MDFDANLAETIQFFGQFRRLVDELRPSLIRIDHSALQRISPAAALVLISDVVRADSILENCKWRGNAATHPEVHELLGEVGYWKYFHGIEWKRSKSSSREFIQHRFGKLTQGEVVKEVVQHFLPELQVPAESKKALYPALIECMDNVMKHAYLPRDKDKPFYHRWHLLGYRDPSTHEVFFCFYDQGVGIPKTIRVRLRDKMGPISRSDADLIAKAVVEGHYSSTKDPTRGRGLPTLKRFIDAAKSGELMIVTFKSRCIFSRENNDLLNFQQKFCGTLIVWHLRN
jgi:anti-sigma regulatory factor (Ser/Thr protein kinase)